MGDAALFTLITGASSGIGRAIALRLSAGAALILHGRNAERLEETRRMCVGPERHLLWIYDLENTAGLVAALQPQLAEAGRAVSVFVHCAGMVTVLPARSVDCRVAQKAMNVNFFSAVEIVNLLLSRKANNKSLENVVLVSSIWSRFGSRAHSMYCASKAALDGWMRALAVELAPVVRVNSVLPGAIDTTMAEGSLQDPQIVENLRRDYPLGLGQPDDIAQAVEFLVSEKARWITGQQVTVDGGRTVNMSLK